MSKIFFWLLWITIVGLGESYYNRTATSGFFTLAVLAFAVSWLVLNAEKNAFWLGLIGLSLLTGALTLDPLWTPLLICLIVFGLRFFDNKLLNAVQGLRFLLLGNAFLLLLGAGWALLRLVELSNFVPSVFLTKSLVLYNLALLLGSCVKILNAQLFHKKEF